MIMTKKLIYLLILLSVYHCQKKENKVSPNNVVLKQKKAIYSIDTNSSLIPKEFVPIDPIVLYKKLNLLKTDYQFKNEFETTIEYNSRIANLISAAHKTPVISNLTIDSLFTIQLSDNSSFFRYDADKEIMQVGINASSSSFNENKFIGTIFKYNSEKVYKVFKNSALIHIDIKKPNILSYWYEIEFANHLDFKKYLNPYAYYNKSLIFNIKMKRDYAKHIKENLRLIATIKLLEPFSNLVLNPYYEDSYFNFIFAKIVQFWIYNIETGEILAKIKAS